MRAFCTEKKSHLRIAGAYHINFKSEMMTRERVNLTLLNSFTRSHLKISERRRDKAKMDEKARNLLGVNEHFESIFNTVSASAAILRWLLVARDQNVIFALHQLGE